MSATKSRKAAEVEGTECFCCLDCKKCGKRVAPITPEQLYYLIIQHIHALENEDIIH